MPDASSNLRAILSLEESHVRQLHQLYQQEWWTRGRSLEDTERAVRESQLRIGIVDPDNTLIAFARVLSDYVFKALILDVIVAHPYRGAALGRRLLSEIKGHEAMAAVRHIELYCLPELIPFYSKFGFTTEVGGVQLMRCTSGSLQVPATVSTN